MTFRRLGDLRGLSKIPPAALLGVGFAGSLSFSYMMLTRMSLIGGLVPERLVEVLVLGVPAIGLLYAGFWLDSGDFTAVEIWEVGSYAMTGLVVAGLGVSLSLLATSLPGLGPREAFFLYVATSTEGAFIGVLIGVVRVTDLLHRDLAEQRHEQAQLARQNEHLEMFASTVSHDLRNPLNVAQGRLELARTECDSDHLAEVERAHERMEALIENLLTLARYGEAVTDPESVALDEVIEACWANVRTGDATLTVEAQRNVRADKSRLQQLLENLFRNAIEHGGEDVTVRAGALDDGFYVEDDGPGIPEGDRDDVFTAGYSTSRDGTGFGLNIVEQVAEAHGWEIRVTEASEGGARFEITGVEFVAE